MNNRITQSMMNIQLQRNLNRNLNQMSIYQNQMSTSRKINKPSDDPVGLSFSLRYRSELDSNDQYQKNVDSATSWLDFTDTMLGQAGDVLQRVRELTVQAANGTNSDSSMDAIKKEMIQLTSQLATIGNSEFNGKHVFNGQITDMEPYDKTIDQDPVTNAYVVHAKGSDADSGEINYAISGGVKLPVNIPGEKVFGKSTDSDNMFKVMENLINGLNQSDSKSVSNLLGDLDSRINKVLATRADVGAKSNRVELASERLKDIGINLQGLQSKTEDVDMAELITNMKTSENVYQASLAVGSKIITPTLIDFLK